MAWKMETLHGVLLCLLVGGQREVCFYECRAKSEKRGYKPVLRIGIFVGEVPGGFGL